MTKQTADQLIKFAEKNLKPEGSLWFFGAEPFCNFEIIKYIVEKSRKKGHKWRFGATTNCTLLNEKRIQWMKKHNFGVLASIDGPKINHDSNRIYADGSGSWEDAWNGLALVRKHLNPNPQIRWTVTPSTLKDLTENIRAMVEDHGLTSLAVDFVYEADWTQEHLDILRKELESFKKYYKKWMQQGKDVFSMFVRDANNANILPERRWHSRCGLGNGTAGVDYDGTLYPCHRFIDSHKIKIGDIYKGFDQRRTQWMDNWQKIAPYSEKPKKCLQCNYKKACTGGCIAMNFDMFGSPHVNPAAFCTIKQLITEVLDDLCKSLQDNPTFKKLYSKNRKTPPPKKSSTQPQKTRHICGCTASKNKPTKNSQKTKKEVKP